MADLNRHLSILFKHVDAHGQPSQTPDDPRTGRPDEAITVAIPAHILRALRAELERDKSYNGWRNYETWNVHLWLSSEEGDWNHWRAIAQHIADNAAESENVKSRIWTTDEAARFALADQLKSELRDGDSFPDLPPSMNSDLLRAAFDEVDWHEVAAALLEGIEPAQADDDEIEPEEMDLIGHEEEPADSGISDADPAL